jgi:hypothetical protein
MYKTHTGCDYATGLAAGVRFPVRIGIFLFAITFRLVVGPTQHHIQLVTEGLFP